MKATEKTLSGLLDELNHYRARASLCPLFFIKRVKVLKLQKRYEYQLYTFPKYGEMRLKALKSAQTTNSLKLYLMGALEGIQIGMKIAAIESELNNQEVANEIKTD